MNQRTKIFKEGKKAVNISMDLYKKIEIKAKKEQLYPSQVINQILKDYLDKE